MANCCWSSRGDFSFNFSAAYVVNCLNWRSGRTLRALANTSRQISLKTRSAHPVFASSINSLQAWSIDSTKDYPPSTHNWIHETLNFYESKKRIINSLHIAHRHWQVFQKNWFYGGSLDKKTWLLYGARPAVQLFIVSFKSYLKTCLLFIGCMHTHNS